MDIFKFAPITGPILLNNGQIIKDIKTAMWIERFRDSGEFTITAREDSDIRNQLPVGTLISHINTSEVMVVENHEINEQKDSETEVTVTGRSFETFLEQRIIGTNQNWPNASPYPDMVIPANFTWIQVVNLIISELATSGTIDDNDALLNVTPMHNVTGTGESFARLLKRGPLYESIIEILAIDKLGIASIRPGTWSPLAAGSPDLCLLIHRGTDRTQSVIFSHDSGDIDDADYLWSNKKLKNAALVSGRWVEVVIKPAQTGYSRRWMFVDASDVDNSYSSPPTGQALTDVRNALTVRGNAALAAQRNIAISKAQASRNLKTYLYRKDFNVGDLVTVNGNYDETTTKRVIEYVEIEDETGESGYPTLSEP